MARPVDVLRGLRASHLGSVVLAGASVALCELLEMLALGHGASLVGVNGLVVLISSVVVLAALASVSATSIDIAVRCIGPGGARSEAIWLGATFGLMVLLSWVAIVPRYSVVQLGPTAWQLLLSIPVAIAVALGVTRAFVRWPGLLRWAALSCLVGGYVLLSRYLYEFSRYGAMRFLHGVGVAAFLALLVKCFGPLGTAPSWGALAKRLLLSVAGLIVGCWVLLLFSNNTMRVLLFERTAFVHRGIAAVTEVVPPPKRGNSLMGQCATRRVRSSVAEHAASTSVNVRGVLLVIVDSLRADRIGKLRSGRPVAPRLEALADQSTQFVSAYASFPGTSESVRAMVEGTYWPRADRRDAPLDLGAILENAGVARRAIIAHKNLGTALGDSFELDARYVEERLPEGKKARTSALVARATLDALRRMVLGHERFVLASHFYDPHAHYVTNELANFCCGEEARYDSEVAYADHWIGWLYDEAMAAGLLQDVALVVVSDHGEEFGDHRYLRHQFRLYDESIRQVLLVRVPGQNGGRRVSRPVSSVDIMPTILQLLGLTPPARIDGESFARWLTSDPPGVPDRTVYFRSAGDTKFGGFRAGRKLILNEEFRGLEIYDLKADARELVNEADRPSGEDRQLYCDVIDWVVRGRGGLAL